MKKMLFLLFGLICLLFSEDKYQWEKAYNAKEFKGLTYHINYKRVDYNVSDSYKTYSSDLAKDFKIQRTREKHLKDS